MSSQRDTFKHAAIYSGAAIFSKIVGFLLLPVYAHIFEDIGFGIIGMFDLGLGFLAGLLAYGMHGAVVRIYHEEKDPADKNKVISTGMVVIGTMCLVLVLVSMLLSRPISWLLTDDGANWPLLCMALGSFFFDLLGRAANTIMVIERRSVLISMISLGQLFISLALNIVLIIVLEMGLTGYFLSALLANLFLTSIYVTLAIRRCGFGFKRTIARKLISFQMPLIPGSLAAFFSRQMEPILVKWLIGIGGVGVLQMAYRWPVLIPLLIHDPFMRSWNTKRVEIAEEEGAPRQIGKMFTYILFLMVFMGLVLAVAIQDLLIILTPESFWIAYRVAQIEVITVILGASYQHFTFGLYYAKDTKTLAMIRGVTSVMKIALSVFFIWRWGIYGAAYSACLSSIAVAWWGYHKAQKRYCCIYERAKIMVIVGVAGLMFAGLTMVDPIQFSWLQTFSQQTVPSLITGLEDTWFGTMRDGAALRILHERSDHILNMSLKVMMCFVFLSLAPMVHEGTRYKLARLLGRRPRTA